MATVTNWIDHLSAAEVQGPVYPGVRLAFHFEYAREKQIGCNC